MYVTKKQMEDHMDPQVAASSLSAGKAKYLLGYLKYKVRGAAIAQSIW
jgi:hypothetical protein